MAVGLIIGFDRKGDTMRIFKNTTVHIANAIVEYWADQGMHPVSCADFVYLYKDGFFNKVTNLHGYIMSECEGLKIGDDKFLGLSWTSVVQIARAILAHRDIYNEDFFDVAPVGVGVSEGFFVPGVAKPSLRPHSPNNRLRVSYGDALDFAEPHAFFGFLDEVFGGDIDAHDKRSVVMELLGCALTGVEISRAALLLGAGSNGKSTLQLLLTEIVGPQHTSQVEPKHLGQGGTSAYYSSVLADSKLNIAGELNENAFKHSSSEIKAMVSRDRVQVRLPYGKPYSARPRAVHIFSSNHAPEITDHTTGFARRLVMLEFNNSFEGRRKSFNEIWSPIKREIPSILGQALLAAGRTMRMNELSVIPASSHERFSLIRLSCPVADFYATACIGGEGETKASDIFDAFVKFIDRRKIHWDGNPTKFGRKFTELLANDVNNPKRRRGGFTYYALSVRPHTSWGSVDHLN